MLKIFQVTLVIPPINVQYYEVKFYEGTTIAAPTYNHLFTPEFPLLANANKLMSICYNDYPCG